MMKRKVSRRAQNVDLPGPSSKKRACLRSDTTKKKWVDDFENNLGILEATIAGLKRLKTSIVASIEPDVCENLTKLEKLRKDHDICESKLKSLSNVEGKYQQVSAELVDLKQQLQSEKKTTKTRLQKAQTTESQPSGSGSPTCNPQSETYQLVLKEKNSLARKVKLLEQKLEGQGWITASAQGFPTLWTAACPVCLEGEWSTVSAIQPCGHALCGKCSGTLKKCPCCRRSISGWLAVYFN